MIKLKRNFANAINSNYSTLLAILTSWLVQLQRSSEEITADMMFKYYMKDDSKYTRIIKRTSVSLSVNYRVKDAFIPSFLIETGRYAIGISYDVTTSQLNAASNFKGGLEVTLRFFTPNAFLYQRKSKSMFN